MAKRDIIVIGASMGGLDAICSLLAALPGDLQASIFVVQHVGKSSLLANIFGRCGSLPVVEPRHCHPIKRGCVYVAPGDHHLLIRNGHIELSKGALENSHRPSIDALFRSASRSYRSRVIALVLSGALDDGAAGVFAVKTRGGVVVVQEPKDAVFPNMPLAAIRAVKPNHVVALSKMPALLLKLVRQQAPPAKARKLPTPNRRAGAEAFTCPDCSGPLFHVQNGNVSQFRCIVGHAYSHESLTDAHREALERAVFTALRLLDERALVHQALARKSEKADRLRPRFEELADACARDAALLREILERL